MREKSNVSQVRCFKICLVSLSLGKGGAERSCAMLSQMLSEYGHEIHTVALTDEIAYDYSGKLFNLGSLKSDKDTFFKRLKRFKKFRDYLKKQQFDLVIDHRPKNQYARELFYAKFLYQKIPRIYVVHNSHQENYFTATPQKMLKIYKENIANIAVSRYIEKNMKNLGIENPVLIHNAVDPSWADLDKNLPEKLKNKIYLLWYGRIENGVKDLTFLLNSFQHSELWKKNIFLVIMGNGKDLEKIKQEASLLPCRAQIVFLAFMKTPFPVISKAHATVLTSKYEGFPMVLVESLSVGTPVVSLDIVSGPSEVIVHKKNGLLVENRDLDSFAKALQEICVDEALYQTCKENTKASVADFSMKVIAEKWDQLIQEVLGSSKA